MATERLFSRRIFCGGLFTGGMGLALAACTRQSTPPDEPSRRDYVFKYPENADEIADFFEVFSEKECNVESLIERLKITGRPQDSNRSLGTTSMYPAQNDLIKNVRIDTQQGFLAGVRLFYNHSIAVSFDQVKTRITPQHASLPPGAVGSVSLYAANIEPPMRIEGTPSNGRQEYSFSAAGRVLIGRVSMSAEADNSGPSETGTHNVWEVEFIK
jgi:hypothetical protein